MPRTVVNSAPATKTGWHLVVFQDGSVAILRWNGNNWVWGSIPQIPSQVAQVYYLGPHVSSFTTDPAGIRRWNSAVGTLNPKLESTLISAVDHGILGLRGRPVAYDSSGNPIGGGSGQTSSEAVFSPVIPGAGTFAGIADAIGSSLDFLKWIAWIFHPLNILRAVEFFIGTLLTGVGLYMLFRRGAVPPQPGRIMRSIIVSSPLGRRQREREGRRMGTREGQREAARMEARREVTRTERVASANERAAIQTGARRRASSATRRQKSGQARSTRIRTKNQ